MATVDIGGWDTHSGQGGGSLDGRYYKLHDEFSKGISALYLDLGEHMNDVVIMACTEFGQAAKQNTTEGLIMAMLLTWFVVGGSVFSGIYGEWLGLRLTDYIVDEAWILL